MLPIIRYFPPHVFDSSRNLQFNAQICYTVLIIYYVVKLYYHANNPLMCMCPNGINKLIETYSNVHLFNYPLLMIACLCIKSQQDIT